MTWYDAFSVIEALTAVTVLALGCVWAARGGSRVRGPAGPSSHHDEGPSTVALLCDLLDLDPPAPITVTVVGVVVAAYATVVFCNDPVAGMFVIVGLFLAGPAIRLMSRRREPSGAMAVIGMTEQLAAYVSAGASLIQAFDQVRPSTQRLRSEVERLRTHVRRGAPILAELEAWAVAADPAEGVPLVVDALALAGRTGGSQAAALQRVALTLRERRELSLQVSAQAAQARASAAVLVIAPVAFAAILCLVDAPVRAAFHSLDGPVLVAPGIAADVAGARWMRRIIRRAS